MRSYLTIFFLVLVIHSNAQNIILLEQDTVSQVNENVDISDDFITFALDLFFKNNTNDSISINWKRELDENCPLEWHIVTADQLITYVPWINESQIPIPMTPIDSHFIVSHVFYPRTVAGCCDIKLLFFLEGDDTNPIDTGYYHIEINADDCNITATHEAESGQFNIYPNPTSTILNIDNKHLIASIEILDIKGKLYHQGTQPLSSQIDLSSFPTGMYYLKIKSNTGELWIKKVVKH